MIRHRPPTVIGLALAAVVLTGCSGGTVKGSPSTAANNSSNAAGATSGSASGSAPKVSNPLSPSALDGSPCDTALTIDEVTEFLGAPKPAESGEDQLGLNCRWTNASLNGASIRVVYETKITDGLDSGYKKVKPTAERFLGYSIQGYPSIGYVPGASGPSVADTFCTVVVGIRDDLTYSVTQSLSDSAKARKVDPCEAAKDVANTVLTNLKARA